MRWGVVNGDLGTAVIVIGVAVLIVRQFVWRSAERGRLLRPPIVFVLLGLMGLIFEVGHGLRLVPADWLIAGELTLVACTGIAMGLVTRFRRQGDRLQYRLTRPGLLLWAIFVVVRLAVLAGAASLGAALPSTSGVILLTFGVNRLAAALVVDHRVRTGTRIDTEPSPGATDRALPPGPLAE